MAGRDKPDLPAHRSLFRMILAPTVWAVHFLFVYGISAVWCAKDWGAARTLSWSITAATVLALALIVGLAVAMWRQWDYMDDNDYIHDRSTDEHRREFLGHAGFMLACLSFVAVVFSTMPAWFAGTCL